MPDVNYAVLTSDGSLIDTETSEEGAVDVAKHFAKRDDGDVILDESCNAGPEEPRQNPRGMSGPEDALKRSGLPRLSGDDIMMYTAEDAWESLRSFLPPGKNYQSGVSSAVGSMLSANAKLAKSFYEEGVSSVARGLSLAPHQIGMWPIDNMSQERWEGRIQTTGKLDPEFDELLHNLGTNPRKPTLCAYSSSQCRSSCLAFSGQNPVVDEPYLAKFALTRSLYANPAAFTRLLIEACRRYFVSQQRAAEKKGEVIRAYTRLNVFQDIPWEVFAPDFFDLAYDVSEVSGGAKYVNDVEENCGWYDYTKIPGRESSDVYDLTFSYSGTNNADLIEAVNAGNRTAIVFIKQEKNGEFAASGGKPLQKTAMRRVGKEYECTRYDDNGVCIYPFEFNAGPLKGVPVLNGDLSDIRPQDPQGYIVGLTYKVARRRLDLNAAGPEYAARVSEARRKGKKHILVPIADVRKQDKFVVRVREVDGVLLAANGPGITSGLVPDFIQGGT